MADPRQGRHTVHEPWTRSHERGVGTQCPAVNGGSVHSSTATRGRSLPATDAATRSSRDPNTATNRCAAGARPILSPTVTMETNTSCKVCGSTVTTCA